MSMSTQGRVCQQVRTIREELSEGFGFRDLLPAELIQRTLQEVGVTWRSRVYTPTVTLWTFLTQVMSTDHSCRNAVAKLLVFLVTSGEKPCSSKTDPYCKARFRLPIELIVRLVRAVGRRFHDKAPNTGLLGGRPIKLIDGSTVSMPDTEANQQAHPQANTQKPGLGFPIARVVAVISLYAGTVLDFAIGPYKGKGTGENALLRTLWGVFSPGDIAVADRAYGSYWNIAWFAKDGVDVVFPLHQQRDCNFRKGKRLANNDHIVTWTKPMRPDWMDESTYQLLPDQITVRELKIRVEQKGFRVKQYILVTTLLDPQQAPNQELAAIYRARWNAELDIRSIKSIMQMDVLRCKSPEMVRKEVWVHLLAYNLIRGVMLDAAQKHDLLPREISFTATLQTLNAFHDLLHMVDPKDLPVLYQILLDAIAHHRVGDRPDRCEPRAVKRRPKPYPLLNKPRDEARQEAQNA